MAQMAKMTLEGVPGFDGTYEYDKTYFTNRELHMIKQVAGVRAGEIEEASEAGDNDLLVAIAVIAMRRNGKDVSVDAIWDSPAGKISFENVDEEEEAEDRPPA